MRMLSPLGTQAQVIVDRLMSFVDRMNVGVLGAVGLALLLYTALSVVQKIEAACNEIWHARKERPLGRKVTDYLSILLIGPILMFSALGIAASVLASQPVKQLSAIQPVGVLIDLSAGLVPVLLVASTFTFLYSFIPNTRVPLGSAFVGGIVATGIWLVAGVAFAQFVHGATSYTAIYSALASLILFFIWLDVSWLIVLLGAAVSFYHAHPEYVLLGSREPCLSNHARERLALAIGHIMGQAMYAGEGPLTAGALGSRLRVPEHTVRQILSAFMAANLVSPTTAQFPRWVLIRPLDSTPVKVLLDAVREYGDGLSIEAAPSLASGWEREIDRALDEVFRNWTLKDLALRNHAPN